MRCSTDVRAASCEDWELSGARETCKGLVGVSRTSSCVDFRRDLLFTLRAAGGVVRSGTYVFLNARRVVRNSRASPSTPCFGLSIRPVVACSTPPFSDFVSLGSCGCPLLEFAHNGPCSADGRPSFVSAVLSRPASAFVSGASEAWAAAAVAANRFALPGLYRHRYHKGLAHVVLASLSSTGFSRAPSKLTVEAYGNCRGNMRARLRRETWMTMILNREKARRGR